MSNFDSLILALQGWFDKPLCDLPVALRQRVEDDFFPMPWDRLNAEGRRSVARQLDYKHDPATEHERQAAWEFSERMMAVESQIAQWEAVATPTALDLAQKEKRLEELRQDLARIEAEAFVAAGEPRTADQTEAPPIANVLAASDVGSREWRTQTARVAANARHDQPGGSRDKQRQIREIWASGKYSSRDLCAEQECAALEMSISTARRALNNTPEPSRC